MNISLLAAAISSETEIAEAEVLKLLVRPKEDSHGDWSFPCFGIAKTLKRPPPACAAELKDKIKLPQGFSRVEAVGPYLNFFYDRQAVAESVITPILTAQNRFGWQSPSGRKVIVEYSSPNIAKTFHVGHLRNSLIGKALDEIYRAQGYDVTSINHLGDWGTQFGIVWAGCELWGKPANPGVDELVEVYVKASKLKKSQEENTLEEADKSLPSVTDMARDYFLRLEAGDAGAVAFWEWARDGSVKYLTGLYDRLGIHFDLYQGESFFRSMIPDVERRMKDSGILVESRGALGVDLGKPLGFVRVFAEDGRSLYITRDIATAIYRYEHFKPEKIIYVVGQQQELYFRQLIEIMRRLKHPVADIMIHVGYGFVPGMKTREGGGISLEGFLNEAKERALQIYSSEVEKRPDGIDENVVAEKVAIGATYIYFLSNSNMKDFQFSWTEALSFQGDTGPYVQYALARLSSMEKKAAESGISIPIRPNCALITDDTAYGIISLLGRFSEIVQRSESEYEPYHIARYTIELAKAVARGYRDLRVVGEELETASARLALFTASRYVLASALKMVGVPIIDRM